MSNEFINIGSANSSSEHFQLRYISISKYEGDWQSLPHTHHFSELFYVLRGEGAFYIENEKVPVKTDDLVIINPYVEHTEKTLPNDPMEYIVFGVEGLAFSFSVISDSSFQLSKECALAKRYIDSNYSQNITLDSLAEITHINKFYLAHSFTECVGQSPINYLTDRRLEACKELLVSSNLSVAQVATSVGFSSQSYFSQIFRKKTGMTPRQYRSRYARK